jgi:hypothetical protein
MAMTSVPDFVAIGIRGSIDGRWWKSQTEMGRWVGFKQLEACERAVNLVVTLQNGGGI